MLDNLTLEAGGHRWQRVPPTERKGRVHSSTVTVSICQSSTAEQTHLREQDLVERFKRAGGPGGQHKNKSECCVVLTHIPTGLSVQVDSRSQANNRQKARIELGKKVSEHLASQTASTAAAAKRAQVGFGERGDKIRTYSAQHGIVTDHRTGKKASLVSIQEGRLDLLR